MDFKSVCLARVPGPTSLRHQPSSARLYPREAEATAASEAVAAVGGGQNGFGVAEQTARCLAKENKIRRSPQKQEDPGGVRALKRLLLAAKYPAPSSTTQISRAEFRMLEEAGGLQTKGTP